MLTRIISAVVGIIILGYTINTGGWVFYIGISLLNICAIYELYNAFKKINIHINIFLSAVFAVVLLYFVSFFYKFDFILVYFFIILMLMLEFLYNIINNNHNRLIDAVFSVFAFIYTSFLFMCIVLVRNLPKGINLTWLYHKPKL
ncbi:MAG TPA: phosphatidate cytidylyltransferase [Thermoanaerobacterales bacterium]|nr:phosphatidate cytidylyltransferase [Thermoanaerobacterales bacterium]